MSSCSCAALSRCWAATGAAIRRLPTTIDSRLSVIFITTSRSCGDRAARGDGCLHRCGLANLFETGEGVCGNRQDEVANCDIEMTAEHEVYRDEDEPRTCDERAQAWPKQQDRDAHRELDDSNDRHEC